VKLPRSSCRILGQLQFLNEAVIYSKQKTIAIIQTVTHESLSPHLTLITLLHVAGRRLDLQTAATCVLFGVRRKCRGLDVINPSVCSVWNVGIYIDSDLSMRRHMIRTLEEALSVQDVKS